MSTKTKTMKKVWYETEVGKNLIEEIRKNPSEYFRFRILAGKSGHGMKIGSIAMLRFYTGRPETRLLSKHGSYINYDEVEPAFFNKEFYQNKFMDFKKEHLSIMQNLQKTKEIIDFLDKKKENYEFDFLEFKKEKIKDIISNCKPEEIADKIVEFETIYSDELKEHLNDPKNNKENQKDFGYKVVTHEEEMINWSDDIPVEMDTR